MSDDLKELYRDVILEHSRRPRNFRSIEGSAVRKAEGYNPICGDQLTVFLDLDGDIVRDAAFQGNGCAISMAAASLMTEAVRGKSREDVDGLFAAFHGLVTGKGAGADLGKLTVFAGVSEFPSRIKCAMLAWNAAKAALEGG